jgi:signal transduction histidine kinase
MGVILMEIIIIIDLIAFFASILAVIFVYTGNWRKSNFIIRIFPIILVIISFIDAISNLVNLSPLWESISPFSEAFQLILPILWFFFLYTLLQEVSNKKLKESETKYLQAYNRAEFYKDLFAHDSNNILQNIHSSIELAKMYLNSDYKVNKIHEILEIIESQVKRGAKLISNIQGLSKLERSEVERKQINLKPLLKQAIEYIKNTYSQREINIDLNYQNDSNQILVHANELLLEVFENLLINSVKHNDNKTVKITIKAKKVKDENRDWIRIEFADNGIGISDKLKEKIFQQKIYHRNDSSGMGLGLSLVKKILAIYESKIWVENRVKEDHLKGSKFIIQIPIFYDNGES